MHAALLQHVIEEEGSIRKAARVLEVPRSTLSAWVRKREPEIEQEPELSSRPGDRAESGQIGDPRAA